MGDRMEPTMQLRRLKCRRDVLCWNGVTEEQTVVVLQQLWLERGPVEAGLAGQLKAEWRDVPMVEG